MLLRLFHAVVYEREGQQVFSRLQAVDAFLAVEQHAYRLLVAVFYAEYHLTASSAGAYRLVEQSVCVARYKAILKCQREDGYWNVSLVCPANYGGPEMTGTGLFLYGMAWGVQQGILPRTTYQKAMDKAWKALAASVHEDGFIGYNQGTGKDPAAGQPVTFTSVPDFEDYGTGCLLLGAAEYYKLLKVKK